ncbi:hypothetical protein BDK51DRAFT_30890, partial [Blyttiomyces helicus]
MGCVSPSVVPSLTNVPVEGKGKSERETSRGAGEERKTVKEVARTRKRYERRQRVPEVAGGDSAPERKELPAPAQAPSFNYTPLKHRRRLPRRDQGADPRRHAQHSSGAVEAVDSNGTATFAGRGLAARTRRRVGAR